MEITVQVYAPTALLLRNNCGTNYKEGHVESQNPCGRFWVIEKVLFRQGFESRTEQPVASRCAMLAIPGP
jgi:hypothetical protein